MALPEWDRGGSPEAVNIEAVTARGHAAAELGLDALQAFWLALSPAMKREVGGAPQLESWKRTAKEADNFSPNTQVPALGPVPSDPSVRVKGGLAAPASDHLAAKEDSQ